MAQTSVLAMPGARSFLALVGLLGVLVGLLGMHVWAGGHQLYPAGPAMSHAAPAGIVTAPAGSDIQAVDSMDVPRLSATDTNTHGQMSMSGTCTLDRPALSVDGKVELPSTASAPPGGQATSMTFPRGCLPTVSPPSLDRLGISRT